MRGSSHAARRSELQGHADTRRCRAADRRGGAPHRQRDEQSAMALHRGSRSERAPPAWRIGVERALRRGGATRDRGSIDKTRFAVSDASRAIQSMLLTAWAEGVGSNWVGFGGLDKVKALLDIPDKLEVLAILPFGHPVRVVGRGKKQRKTLSEVAHLERFGRPFD